MYLGLVENGTVAQKVCRNGLFLKMPQLKKKNLEKSKIDLKSEFQTKTGKYFNDTIITMMMIIMKMKMIIIKTMIINLITLKNFLDLV